MLFNNTTEPDRWFSGQHRAFYQLLPELHRWLSSPLGARLLTIQAQRLEHWLPYIFGYHLVQVGISPDLRLLDTCRITHKSILTPRLITTNCSQLQGSLIEWPIQPSSVDMVFLHHALEFFENPHRLLAEANKAIIPGGKLIVIGFNPYSLLNLWRGLGVPHYKFLRQAHFIRPGRLQDWFKLLGFSLDKACYPAVKLADTQYPTKLDHYCESIGLGIGSFYIMQATKETVGMTPIKPVWRPSKPQVVTLPLAEPTTRR
ncbi:methyltransferase domain-containing protein [Spartinivicinus ruber]|uniref:methyltransferase domain-containing protein n=1 Tax=Spartinivicinus ruber TaxID=2683272 RepID=UPI0013CFF475|nr:methyltransferase domain-containing protein [Spartinivicinus ruber]